MADIDLVAALTRGRKAVERYMSDMREQIGDPSWSEEHATIELLRAAYPEARWIPFHRRQEVATGADWLWWWISPDGECFGMLVQAKSLKRSESGRWYFDFNYNNGSQMRSLLDTARRLEVAPVYMLYCGDHEHRSDLRCATHTESEDDPCHRAAVSIVAALAVEQLVRYAALDPPGESGADAFLTSKPLEDVVQDTGPPRVYDLNIRAVGADLRSFLLEQQYSVRQVAKEIFAAVVRMRLGQFSAAVAERADVGTQAVFASLPTDHGHFSEPYYSNILRGLRPALPEYVSRSVTGELVTPDLTEGLAGIVLVDVE